MAKLYVHLLHSSTRCLTRLVDFEVTDPLPNVTFASSRTFAGNIGVQRDGHPNNTLFFWAVEKTNSSLTVDNSTEPWGIWLNGGPGSSSMAGFLWEVCMVKLGESELHLTVV